MDRTINGEVYERTLVLDRASIDNEQRTVPAALSSEIEVDRWFGREMLVHDDDSIDLSRVNGGLPMLFNHNTDIPIGNIRDIHLDGDRKLRGTLHFSKNAKASEVWGDVRDGFLKDISIGYRIQKWEEESDDLVRVTRWMLHEASVVSVPADSSVGINRNLGGQTMPDTPENKGGDKSAPNDDLNVVDFQMNRERNIKQGKDAGMKEERKRISEVRRIFAPHVSRGSEYSDLMDACIDRGVTIKRSTDALLEMLAGDTEPLAGDFQQEHGSMDTQTTRDLGTVNHSKGKTHVVSGKDEMEKFIEGAERALLVKSGVITDKEEVKAIRANEFHSMSLSELPREYLRRAGDTAQGGKLDIVGKALTRQGIISHGTSDFSNLLANVANKSLQIGFEEAPETWSAWCRTGSIPDFRQADRPNLSTFGDLQVVYENGEYKYGTFSDLKESLTLVTYGKLFSISRQAIINDDLNALSRIPQNMGRAAARKIGDLAYAVLTSNPTLNQDSTSLFDVSDHANYVTSGAAPSVTTIEAAKVAMGTQTDPAGNTLNIRPSFLLVPLALEGTAQVLQSSMYDPAGTAGTLTPNTVQGTFEVISDPRLDTANSAGWYMAANPSMHETVEVAFLDGNQAPYMEQKDGWSQDGTEFKVRIDAVAAPLDYRGLYYNDGVT